MSCTLISRANHFIYFLNKLPPATSTAVNSLPVGIPFFSPEERHFQKSSLIATIYPSTNTHAKVQLSTTRAPILLLQWCHNDLPLVGQWSISDFTMVNLFVYDYSRLPNLSKTCHFDNLLTIVRSVIEHCDTIAIAD